jgi:hypothetical protein
MPVKRDAAWWRQYRATKAGASPAPQGQGVSDPDHGHFMSDGKPVLSRALPDADFAKPRVDVTSKQAHFETATTSSVELSSDAFVTEARAEFAKVDPHLACNLLEARLRAVIADLEADLAHAHRPRQGEYDPYPNRNDLPTMDLDEVFR